MPEKILYPASYLLKDLLPTDMLMGLDEAIDFLAVDPDYIRVEWTNEGLATSYRFYILQELSFSLPFLSEISIHIGEPDSFPYFDLSFQSNPIAKFSIENIRISIRATAKLLQAYEKDGELWQPKSGVVGYQLGWNTGISADVNGKFDFRSPELSGAPPFMIGDSGFIIDFSESSSSERVADIRWISDDIPAELVEKIPPGFTGMFISRAAMHYHKVDSGTRLPRIGIEDAGIGSGGFSGNALVGDEREEPAISEERLKAEDFDPSELTGDHIVGFELGGMEIILWHLRVSFMQSIPDGFLLTGFVFMPFADKWMKFKASAGGPEADFMLEIGGAADAPLVSLEHELFEIKADSIAYKLLDDVHYAIITGSIRPKLEGFDWPEMKVDGLSISSEGDISIPGGWLKAPNEITLDFHAFKIGISEIGFGNEGEEVRRQWLGFSGSLNLVEGLELKASVEGLKFSWLKEPDASGDRHLSVSLTGVEVAFEIPNTLSFEGAVKYEKLTAENNSGTGLTGDLFKGNIKLNLMAVRLEIQAELMIGKLSDADGNEFTTFFIVLGAQLPVGLPLGATGTSLYGIDGLAAVHAGPTKTESQNWYEWYLAEPERNITSVKKWKPIYDQYGFGAGVSIGTMYDDGFTLNMRVMLVVLIPGPVILLEGKANLLKQRSDNKEESGAFYLLAVLDGRAGTFMLNIDVRYTLEDVITVGAGLEAFFDFNSSENWYIHIGKKEPENKRIRAEILSLFKASAYFMIDPKSFQTGASVGVDIRKRFGPVSFSLVARISFDAAIFWKPLQLHGALEMYGELALKVFGIGIELILQMLLEGKAPERYWIHGFAMIKIKLFWPLPDLKLEVEFEWTQPGETEPVAPLLKACSFIHHKDNGAIRTIALSDQELTPVQEDAFPIVPVDARPVLTFARPVHNLRRNETGGARLPLFTTTQDEVGGQNFEYRLDELELEAWNGSGWDTVRKDVNTGATDHFGISRNNHILNLKDDRDPNEPQIQLWQYTAADLADRYQREDYADHHPPCNPTTQTQWFLVDWQGVANTQYDYQFEYSGLEFVCDENERGRAPQVYSSPALHTPNLFIHFPESVYRVAVYLTQETSRSHGYVLKDGRRVAALSRTGMVLTYTGTDPVDSLRIEGSTLIITSVAYMTQKGVLEQLAGFNDNHPSIEEQNTNGPLVLAPATYYRLKAATSVASDDRTLNPRTDYMYFRTDEGPGINTIQRQFGNPRDPQTENLEYVEKPVHQFAGYIERTLPVDGAGNFYHAYDMGIQFNEAYVEEMYPNDIRMVVKDRNGKVLEAPTGLFTEGFLPLMPMGLLTWLEGKERGGCDRGNGPVTPSPYLNFAFTRPFVPNSLYTTDVVTSGSTGEQNLHKFQFTTSRYARFTDHILSGYPEARITAIALPRVSAPGTANPGDFKRTLSNYNSMATSFFGSGDLSDKYDRLQKTKELRATLDAESLKVFETLDKLVDKSLRIINMQNRPGPSKFEIFKVPIKTENKNLWLMESPEPIDWMRLQALAVPDPRIRIKLGFIWNEDQTRAFAYHNTGFLFRDAIYKTKFVYSGEADPISGIILKGTTIVNEEVKFQIEF